MNEQGLLELMDRHGVDQVVVTSTRGIMIDPREGNDEAAGLASRHPDRIRWLCCLNPCDDAAAVVELERCSQQGKAVGVRLAPQHQAWDLNADPYVAAVVVAAQRLGLFVLLPLRLIMDWRLPAMQITAIGTFVAKHPNCTFVLSGVNYHDLRMAIHILARNANALIETSCLMGRDGVKQLVERIGSERVLLGLGLPLQSGLCGLVKVQRAKVKEEDKRLILGMNARRLIDRVLTREAVALPEIV
jgi:predicted TIM-barrel fold metal-dependent hydrolase